MGFLRKLKKRDDRFARVGKSKAAKRDAKVENKHYFAARNEAERIYMTRERSRFLAQLSYIVAIRDTFGFGIKRLSNVVNKAVGTANCCIVDKMFTLKEIRDQLELETGYDVPLDDYIEGDFAFQETKHTVDEVTVFYLWALNDLYKMRKRRLAHAYAACEQVSKAFSHDASQVYKMTKEIWDAGLHMRFHSKPVIEIAKEIAGM